MGVRSTAFAVVLTLSLAAAPARAETLLLRTPTVSADSVAFVYANDVWVAPRDGGDARRLTTFDGAETEPRFSPDGRTIAFSGQYDGNTDVYVVPVAGGEPRRLTWHPLPDRTRGWTPDGRVLFASGRATVPRPWDRLWTIGVGDVMPRPLPAPRASRGGLSPDGGRLAYELVEPWESEWRNYRGGQAQPIRVLDLGTLEVEKLPWDGSNDRSPVWLGEQVFFLSDRDQVANVWSWNGSTGELAQRTSFTVLDCKSLAGGHGRLVFENGGALWTLDAAGGEARKLSITVRGDFPWARPHWEEVGEMTREGAISPTGKRAVFEARGDIFTVPSEKGDVRNLTHSSGAADRAPAWSPDGTRIAWFSDESGEYQLVIADQFGRERRAIELAEPTFYYTPRWSPDSKHIAFGDADRNLWVVDVASGQRRLVGNEGYAMPERLIYPEWSPDSRWIAHSRRLPSQLNAVFVYSLESAEARQITDGLSNAHSPAWDASGRYLYLLASTGYGLNVGWLDMSSIDAPLDYSVYAAVLAADEPSPLAPESDDENAEPAEDEKAEAADVESPKAKSAKAGESPEPEDAPPAVKIDFEGLDRRIVALGLPKRGYTSLEAGVEGVLFASERVPNEPGLTLHRYSLEEREAKKLLSGVRSYALSADGSKLLYSTGPGEHFIVDADGEPSPGDGKLDIAELRMKVDPPAEWRQIFREAWRFQRDFFYVDNVHGLDLDWAWATYSPWLDHLRHRADLTYLLDILGGETAIGHSFTGGGDEPDVEQVTVGLLGADWEVAEGRYRITRVYDGESWNPELAAPLSGPALDAAAGDYLLAVDGVEITTERNLYSYFDRTAGRQTRISLHTEPRLDGARELTVVPVEDEVGLRARAWVEDNRRQVSELSDGRLAYVWVPDTGGGGLESFTRYYFAQLDRQGAIIDERFNHGGFVADFIIDVLDRELFGYFSNPVGDRHPFTAPNGAIYGPKVMLINEMSGSGGDMLPYMFRKKNLGPLVGTTTWGGLVGIWDVPQLVDGGFITAPRGGFYNVDGEWEVENEGVPPDVIVEQLPKLVAEGHDPQLEEGVRLALEMLEEKRFERLPQPPDPVRVPRPGGGR